MIAGVSAHISQSARAFGSLSDLTTPNELNKRWPAKRKSKLIRLRQSFRMEVLHYRRVYGPRSGGGRFVCVLDRSLAYSALGCSSIGMLGSAFFRRVKKSW